MEYLIAVDLEGVNNVVGEPYSGLSKNTSEYVKAINQAVLEINATINALFDGGATKVFVWDNHGGGNNLDFSKIDGRAQKLDVVAPCTERFEFCKTHNFKGAIYIGYHSREGSINGVLAHTYNSSTIQYFKIGNNYVGEFELDASISSAYGIAPLFACGDDVFISQVKEFSPSTVTIVTKKATGRNLAIFKNNDALLQEIYNGVKLSLTKNVKPICLPLPNNIEIRYTRTERAKEVIDIQKQNYNRDFTYGEDAHTIVSTVNDIEDLKHSIIT